MTTAADHFTKSFLLIRCQLKDSQKVSFHKLFFFFFTRMLKTCHRANSLCGSGWLCMWWFPLNGSDVDKDTVMRIHVSTSSPGSMELLRVCHFRSLCNTQCTEPLEPSSPMVKSHTVQLADQLGLIKKYVKWSLGGVEPRHLMVCISHFLSFLLLKSFI